MTVSLAKKRFHPCGGFYLEGVMKWIPGMNVLMLLVGVVLFVKDVYEQWDRWMREKIEIPQDYYIRLGFWLGYNIHFFFGMPMDFFLYRSCKSKNTLRMTIWGVFNFFNTLLAVVDYWAHTYYFGLHYFSLAMYNGYCIYRFYTCVVIYYYIQELEDEEEFQGAARALTDTELQEFEEGLEYPGRWDAATKTLMDKVLFQRYKRDEYEMSLESLDIDAENPLGRGQYGVVYRGSCVNKDGISEPVAVKTFEPGYFDALSFKALLTELKVMTYLGKHDHVVNLIGAVTAEIKSRRLYMVVEFCPFGNLLETLNASRALYVNAVKGGEIQYDQLDEISNQDEILSTKELLRWSYEITSGMAYLEEMKVIHGDLASRNLLLTQNKEIKIADFGLARQLYQYSVYVKRQNVPLPWRWLAIESLTDMSFSSKSDIWSFAVTLYEIFTLGGVPYSNMNIFTFSLDFIDKLKQGIRLEQPKYCPTIIFSKMEDCWNPDPDARPTFTQLNKFFHSFINKNKAVNNDIPQRYSTRLSK